jgi:V8-like Glu-specific endopeptidase
MKFFLSVHFLLGLLLGPAAVANTFTPSSSFPGDTRTIVTTPGTPWRCIGKLSCPGARFMTASLVGPNVILTAAHGLVSNGQLKAGQFIFRPDWGSPHNRTPDFATVTRVWLGTYTPEKSECSDWALLQLDKNLGAAYGTLAVDDADGAALSKSGQHYYMSSYNRDFKYGAAASWQTGCGFVSLDPLGYLLHDFSTAKGASGSPIFYFSTSDFGQNARIVALNVAEKTPHNETLYDVPFSSQVANVAISSHQFFGTLRELLSGKSAPPGGEAVGGTVSSDRANSRPIGPRSNSS